MSALRAAAAALALLAAVTIGAAAEGPHEGHAGAAALAGPAPPRPPVDRRLIPFGPVRKRQMAAYSARHYGERAWRLRQPRVIVAHVALAGSVGAVFNAFAPNGRDPELGELPNVCAHFVVGSGGRIVQLVNLRTRCRHTIGLNWTAIGIEHVGFSDAQLLGNRRQLAASLRLTRYLRCRFGIRPRDVIGHGESLRSRFHRERVPRLRTQTHGDLRRRSMRAYRRALGRQGPCPPARQGVGESVSAGSGGAS